MADKNTLTPEQIEALTKALEKMEKTLGNITATLKGQTKEVENQNDEYRHGYSRLKAIHTVHESIRKDGKEYITLLKEWQKNQKLIIKLENQLKEIKKEGTKDEKDYREALKDELYMLKRRNDAIKAGMASFNKSSVALKTIGKETVKLFIKIPDLIQKGYGQIKNSGLFEMDKAIRMSSMSMGLLGKQSESFKTSILLSAQGTNKLDGLTAELGVSLEEITKYQSDYSDELGRNVMLGEKGYKAIAEMARGTVLGADGATKMASELENFSVSAEDASKFIEKASDDASDMGINSGKVVKNIAGNLKMMNKYNFKDGLEGLKKMALTATKLGIDMKAIEPFADKLFDIDGAVEMSAQLQVLGGKWAALADPFKLMYMARNDMDGLTKSIGEAASESMSFAKDGSIQMSSLEMSRLRKITEQTGIAYDDLATAGKNAFKAKTIKAQITGLTDAEMEFISNSAKFSQDGKTTIDINGSPKLLSQLTDADKAVIDAQIKEKSSLEKRAKDAMTFDDKLTALINGIKVDLFPIVDTMEKELVPALGSFVKEFIAGGWGKNITELAKGIGSLVSTIGGFILKNPFTSAIVYFGTKILANAVTWYENGKALALGFNSQVSIGGEAEGLASKAGGKGKAGGIGGFFSSGIGKRVGGGIGGLGVGAIDAMSADSTAEGTGNVIGGILGGAAGTLLDEFMGPFGTILGAKAGSYVGGLIGKAFTDSSKGNSNSNVQSINDGVVFHPNDKFMKVNDGTMIAGTNVNGNKDLAKALNNQQISSPASSSSTSLPNNIMVQLGDLKINGTIELKMPGTMSKDIGVELMNDPTFIRNISKLVNTATQTSLTGKPS